MNSPEVERRLEETARYARSSGASKVPTFVVGEMMFFGNDRLVLVRYFLA